ncbi:MAG: LamG domain-containing protein, partial [Kiritimatiellae bacterium]|nr:LamG domain-containing protein [Kiritimatiellia bacterium]
MAVKRTGFHGGAAWVGALALAATTFAHAGRAAQDDWLIAYWPLDEGCGCTVWDAGDGVNTGSLSRGMRWATGEFGAALAFTGVDSTVTIGKVSGMVPSDAATVSLWARWNGEGRGKYPSLLTCGTWINGGIMFLVSDGSLSFRIRSVTDDGQGTETSLGMIRKIPSGRWTHLAVAFSRPNLVVYVDGKEVSRIKWDRSFPMLGRVTLGAWGGKSCHDGFIDDLRIHSRALSPREIADLAGDGRHVEMEGYQDDGTGGVKKTELHGQEARAALTLKGDRATLVLDELGRISSIREAGSGRELLGDVVPFLQAALVNGATQVPRRLERRAGGGFSLVFARGHEVEFSVKPFDGGWGFRIEKSDLQNVKQLSFCCVKPECAEWKGHFVNAWTDRKSAVCVRSGDIYGDPRAHAMLSVDVDGSYPLVGRTAYLAAGPRDGFRGQLKAMTLAAQVPHSPSGGAWAMDSDVGRRSYFFFYPYPWNLEWGLSLARRGGFSNLH